MKLKTVKIQNSVGKWLIFAPFLALTVTAFFVGRWAVGGTTATQLRLTEEPSPTEAAQVLAVADFAVELAPDDPTPRFILGSLQEKSFLPENLQKALGSFEKAAALAPDDYRFWVGYARAAGRNDQMEIAERAARRALELAPNYGVTNWTLGNIYLRSGRENEAYPLLSKAVGAEPLYAPSIFGLLLDANGNDAQTLTRLLGDTPEINRAAVPFFAKQQRVNDSYHFWQKLSPEDKTAFGKEKIRELTADLINAKGYKAALAVQESVQNEIYPNAAFEKITDGGFEDNFTGNTQNIFNWKIAAGDKPEIGANLEEKHGGNQSMVLVFRRVRSEFREVEQIVAVESNKRYRLEFFVKSTNLKPENALRIDVIDTIGDKIIASSMPFAAGTTDWQSLNVDFTTGAETQGVKIRLARMPCTVAPCEINGLVRLDDFSLKAF